MIERTFKHASASEAGDYYQVSFDDGDDYEAGDIDNRYLPIQRQFEFPDGGTYYLESDDSRLCGHFKIRAATLSTAFLSIECLADKWTVLRIHYPAGQDDYKELV